MRSALVLVVSLLAGCRPGPGETKCRTTMMFGVAHTTCEQGPPVAAEEQPSGYWCWTRPLDDVGVCHRRIGDCEASRTTSSSSGPSATSGECTFAASAVCADGGCGPNIKSCALFERQFKRGPDACDVKR